MHLLKRPDGVIAYQSYGARGPTVLAIQGVGCIGNTWKPQAQALAQDHRITVFDNRGVGGSSDSGPAELTVEAMARDARALLDALGYATCHVLGHSLGGLIALCLALQAPERVASLCLMCTADRAEHPPIIMRQLRALSRYDCLPLMERLAKIPTLVISAESDPIAPPALGRALAAAIPNARFELLTGASHAAPLQQPERVNGMLRQFFARS
jgi:pimeloyl-ACP methyl ester carboxylesterase